MVEGSAVCRRIMRMHAYVLLVSISLWGSDLPMMRARLSARVVVDEGLTLALLQDLIASWLLGSTPCFTRALSTDCLPFTFSLLLPRCAGTAGRYGRQRTSD